jgi:hypothetical protein
LALHLPTVYPDAIDQNNDQILPGPAATRVCSNTVNVNTTTCSTLHRSGENNTFTAAIVVRIRHTYHLPSHA